MPAIGVGNLIGSRSGSSSRSSSDSNSIIAMVIAVIVGSATTLYSWRGRSPSLVSLSSRSSRIAKLSAMLMESLVSIRFVVFWSTSIIF